MREKRKTREEILGASPAEFAEWIRTSSDEDFRWLHLDQRINQYEDKGWIMQQEQEARAARSTHHWTFVPALIIGSLTMIFAGIAAWPIARDWIWPPVKKAVRSEFAPALRTQETPIPLTAQPGADTQPRAQATVSVSPTPISEPQP